MGAEAMETLVLMAVCVFYGFYMARHWDDP
jgi:hypothetical protein